MTKTILLGLSMIAMLAISPMLSNLNSFAESDTLPGGTSIEVSINTPADETVIPLPLGDTTVDVTVEGTASVGEGVPLKDTDIIYIVDVSGSMNTFANVDCDGDGLVEPNTSSQIGDDQIIDCAVAGIAAVDQAAAEPFSSVSQTGLGTFSGISSMGTSDAHDVDLGQTGDQFLVSPAFDGDGNSTPDIVDVISGVPIQGFTSYGAGLDALETILASSTSANKIVIFMSDGANNKAPPVSDFDTTFDGQGVVFRAFAIGEASHVSCDRTSGADNFNGYPAGTLGNLDDVAALTPGGTCENVTDLSTLPDVISESIGSTLETLEIDVDGAGPVLIDNSEISPDDLPVIGPAMETYSTVVTSLTEGEHNICVTATGMTAFGSGDVTDCVDIIVNGPPTADSQSVSTDEDTSIDILLTGSDSNDDPLTFAIDTVPSSGILSNFDSNTGDVTYTPDADFSGFDSFTFTVNDGTFDSEPATVDIEVIAVNDPPVCSDATVSVDSLWPPNHKMESIVVEMTATDADSDVTVSVTDVFQDEPTNGLGDGDESPDAEITGDNSVDLRAERSGNENGRVYTITITATDGEFSCSNSVLVKVPHDKKDNAVDDGAIFDSTTS